MVTQVKTLSSEYRAMQAESLCVPVYM